MRCSHQFIIPPPNGPMSVGVCKLCGEMREMTNFIDETTSWQKQIQATANKAKQAKHRKV